MNIEKLREKRDALAKQSVERQLAEVNAQIAAAEAAEAARAEQERQAAHEAALADARGQRDAAQSTALEHLRAFVDALAPLEAAEATLRELGVLRASDESLVNRGIRQEAKRALAWLEERERLSARAAKDAAEAAEWAALAPEEQRRRTAEQQLEHWQECRARHAQAGRDHEVVSCNRHIALLRAELGVKAPLGERLFGHAQPDRGAVTDEALAETAAGWHSVAERLRAQERAKERAGAQAEA